MKKTVSQCVGDLIIMFQLLQLNPMDIDVGEEVCVYLKKRDIIKLYDIVMKGSDCFELLNKEVRLVCRPGYRYDGIAIHYDVVSQFVEYLEDIWAHC